MCTASSSGISRRDWIWSGGGEAVLRYEIGGQSAHSLSRLDMRVIESAAGEPAGLLAHNPWLWGDELPVFAFELRPGLSWAAVLPSVLRYLRAAGDGYSEPTQNVQVSEGEETQVEWKLTRGPRRAR